MRFYRRYTAARKAPGAMRIVSTLLEILPWAKKVLDAEVAKYVVSTLLEILLAIFDMAATPEAMASVSTLLEILPYIRRTPHRGVCRVAVSTLLEILPTPLWSRLLVARPSSRGFNPS